MAKKTTALKSDPRKASKPPEKSGEMIRNFLKAIRPFCSIAVTPPGARKDYTGIAIVDTFF